MERATGVEQATSNVKRKTNDDEPYSHMADET
jgi:hypothetical protein